MQGKFKWVVLIVICLSLIYLAFTNRYVGYPLKVEIDLTKFDQIPIVYYRFYTYDKWTGKIDWRITENDSLIIMKTGKELYEEGLKELKEETENK